MSMTGIVKSKYNENTYILILILNILWTLITSKPRQNNIIKDVCFCLPRVPLVTQS